MTPVAGNFALLVLSIASVGVGGNLCVTMRDPGGGAIPNASAVAVRQSEGPGEAKELVTRSNEAGQACFFELLDGRYALTIRAPGFLEVTYRGIKVDTLRPGLLVVNLLFGDVIELNVTPTAQIGGRLMKQGKPVVRGVVCAFTTAGVLYNCTLSDKEGQYGLVVQPGNYRIEVTIQDSLVFKKDVSFEGPGVFRDLIVLN